MRVCDHRVLPLIDDWGRFVSIDEDRLWRLEIQGEAGDFDDPPPDLGIEVLSVSRSAGFDGTTLLALVVAIPWVHLATDIGVHLFSAWLYETFASRRKKRADFGEANSGTSININGNVFILTSAEQLGKALDSLSADAK